MVAAGKELPANKSMRANFQKFNNPLGELKKGKKFTKYYT